MLSINKIFQTDTLQSVYNNSLAPEILTNSTLGALSIKRGSALDTDNVIEIINGTDVITSSITGDGVLKIDDIVESTLDAGVTIENVKLENEYTKQGFLKTYRF